MASAAARAARMEENSPSVRPPRPSMRPAISPRAGTRLRAVAARRRQMRGDVEDSGFGVVERRADVQAPPPRCLGQPPRLGHRVERPADGQRCRGQHHRCGAEHLRSVAHRPSAAPPAARGSSCRPFFVVEPHHVGAIGDHRGERLEDPGGGVGDLAQRGDGLGTGLRRPSDRPVWDRWTTVRRPPDRAMRSGDGQFVVEMVDPARLRVMDGRGERGDRGLQALGQFRADQSPGPAHRDAQGRGLDSAVATEVTRSVSSWASSTTRTSCSAAPPPRRSRRWPKGVVGDDDVGVGGCGARLLGEAVDGVRAAGRAEAFPGRDADLCPGPLRYAGPKIVAVSALGVRGPRRQPRDIAAQRADRRRIEQFLLAGTRRVLIGVAWILLRHRYFRRPLSRGEGGSSGRVPGQRVDHPGQVTVDELALQGDGRGGHHHRASSATARAIAGTR